MDRRAGRDHSDHGLLPARPERAELLGPFQLLLLPGRPLSGEPEPPDRRSEVRPGRCGDAVPGPGRGPRPSSGHEPVPRWALRSEEHTSELQSLMRISYAVFCLKKKKNKNKM